MSKAKDSKSISWTNDDGTKYQVSYSEQLQLKNLEATKRQTEWLKMNFYAKVMLLVVGVISLAVLIFVLYRLDAIDFFTRIAYR